MCYQKLIRDELRNELRHSLGNSMSDMLCFRTIMKNEAKAEKRRKDMWVIQKRL